MLKDDKNTFKYVKLEEGFLSDVIKKGSRGEAELVYFFEKPKRCLMINHNRKMMTCYLKNDFQINSREDEEDLLGTAIFQRGMLKVLPPEEAKRYMSDLQENPTSNFEERKAELLALLEQ